VRLSLVLLHADSGRKSGRQVTAGFSPPPSGPRREGGFVFGSAGGAKDNSPRRKPWVIVWWGISPGWGKRKVVVQLFLSLLAELEPLVSQTHGLTPWAIVNCRSAAQGKTWAGVTVLLSEQVGISPTL